MDSRERERERGGGGEKGKMDNVDGTFNGRFNAGMDR